MPAKASPTILISRENVLINFPCSLFLKNVQPELKKSLKELIVNSRPNAYFIFKIK